MTCAHPKCAAPIEGQVVLGKISRLPYCSPEHRFLDGCRRRQAARRDPEVERWDKIRRKYGVSKEEWEEIFERQGGRCAICRKKLVGKICLDHDHDTDEPRGLLCNTCNQGLGYFDDDPELMRAAMAYLLNAGREVSEGGD